MRTHQTPVQISLYGRFAMARWRGYIFSFCLTWAVMARLIFSMLAIALILLPDFSLILLGLLLRRRFAYPAEFWGHLERLVYYLMFPALLFRAVSRTELDIAPALDMFIAGFGFSLVGIALGVLGRWLFKPDGRVFASCVQTGFRFNTYIGLAVVDRLSGHAGRVQDRRNARHVGSRHLAFGQVIHSQHRVRLAATEGGLQLDHRIATAPGQAMHHRIQQQAHAFGDEGALEEQRRVLVLGGRRAQMHTRQVGRELGLLEGALEHVLVWNGDFAPRLQTHPHHLP